MVRSLEGLAGGLYLSGEPKVGFRLKEGHLSTKQVYSAGQILGSSGSRGICANELRRETIGGEQCGMFGGDSSTKASPPIGGECGLDGATLLL